MVLGIVEIGLRLKDRRALMRQVEILNDFNTLTFKQVFWKTKTLDSKTVDSL